MTEIPASFQQTPDFELQTLFDALSRQTMRNLNCARIGVIQEFFPETQTVNVKLAQLQVTSIAQDGTRTFAEYPPIQNVPVFFPSGGGFTLTFPIAAGDECVLLFNDRQLDLWLANGAGFAPVIGRLHDLSDAICFVGVRSNPRALADVSDSTVQLRTDDGDTFVEVQDGGIIRMVAPTKIRCETPLLEVTGDVVAGTISLRHHVHDGVQPGGGDTGEPVI